MAVDPKTLQAIRKWGRAVCKRERERAATVQSATKGKTMSLTKALEQSRQLTGNSSAPAASKNQSGTARFVERINSIAKAQAESNRTASERASTHDGHNALWDFFNKPRR